MKSQVKEMQSRFRPRRRAASGNERVKTVLLNRNGKRSANGNGTSDQSVRLEFIHPSARSVSVAGTFNDWRPGATEMVSVGNGRWLKELVLPSGVYEYRLVVDGEWLPDPLGRETAPNPFGGLNSVLRIEAAAQ